MEDTKVKILFVDDDEFLRKVYKSELSEQGYEVTLAIDGQDGLNQAQKIPDLILLDIIMPQKNGFEVLEALKSNASTKNIPVIMFSNLAQENDIKKCMDLGAVDYLVKGQVTLATVLSKIKENLPTKKPPVSKKK